MRNIKLIISSAALSFISLRINIVVWFDCYIWCLQLFWFGCSCFFCELIYEKLFCHFIESLVYIYCSLWWCLKEYRYVLFLYQWLSLLFRDLTPRITKKLLIFEVSMRAHQNHHSSFWGMLTSLIKPFADRLKRSFTKLKRIYLAIL